MPNFPLPIRGISSGMPDNMPVQLTSGYMDNIRIKDVLEKKIRISQRPGLDKVFDEQIGAGVFPIIAICTITTVD